MKFILIAVILFACANRLVSPPSSSFQKKGESKHNSNDNQKSKISFKYAQEFKKLQSDTSFDCQYFAQKDFDKFPLQILIDLHLEIFCGHKKIKTPKWLKKKRTELILTKNQINESYLQASLHYLRYIKTQHKKEAFLLDKIKQFKKFLINSNHQTISENLNQHSWIKELTKKLYEVAPRLSPDKIKGDNDFLIARDFERNRKFKTARSFYRKILLKPRESLLLKIKSWERTLKTYKNERKKKKYLLAIYKFRRWLKRNQTRNQTRNQKNKLLLEKVRQRWSIRLARTLWSLNQSSKAKYFLIQEIKKEKYSKRNQSLMHWLVAQIWLEKKKPKRAVIYLNKAILINSNDLLLKEKILWSLSFTNILLKKYKEAGQLLEQNIIELEKVSPRPRLQFWLAYCYKEMNNSIYQAKLLKLANEHPYNYYGIISKIILKIPFENLKTDAPLFPSTDLKFSWLYYLNEKELLEQYSKFNISKKKLSLKKYFSYLYYSEEFNKAIFSYYALNYSDRDQLKEIVTSFLFPTPFKDEITSISKEAKIMAPLVFSITRQESAFNPLARSHADAFGLMQLIPLRAKEMAKKLNIKYSKSSDLYDPVTNLKMGSFLLKQTLVSYRNNFVKTVASYNAGRSAISNWFKHRFTGDYYKFIELIPYRETRKYVKLTFRNYIVYKQLLAKKPFLINQDIFENLNGSYAYLAESQN